MEIILETVRARFPDTTLTFIEGDAADASFIEFVIDRVINQAGHLDFFFPNSGVLDTLGKEKEQRVDGDPGKFFPEMWSDVFETSEEDFLAFMRIDTASKSIALKYASQAMSILCPERGKILPGGSYLLPKRVAMSSPEGM
ncbi:hypothetical protein IAR50_003838 [Cryptococcus sp. DSM 104548]